MGMSSGGGADELKAEINVTPLVDVMLVLLIIFMITAPLLNTGVDIQLPKVDAQAIDDPEGKLLLTIKIDKKVYLGEPSKSPPIAWKDLQTKLATNERLKREGEIYIAADPKLPYAVIVTAMALIKKAGVPKVMMLTEPGDNLTLDELDKSSGP